MLNVPAPHRFVVISSNALTKADAHARITSCVQSKGVNLNAMLESNPNPTLIVNDGLGNTSRVTYLALLAETEKTGVVPELDRMLWRDTHERGSIAAATDANEFPPLIAQAGIRQTSALEAPGLITTDVVSELLDDVLIYREETAALSFFDDELFRPCFRAYRAYLSASISAVDAWLNERAWYVANDPTKSSSLTLSEIGMLKNRYTSIVKKLRTWPVIMFRSTPLDEKAAEWLSFDRIRQARNEIVHVNEPEFNFALRCAVHVLNDCCVGVGSLLAVLHGLEGTYPMPAVFAVKLAAEALFVPKAA